MLSAFLKTSILKLIFSVVLEKVAVLCIILWDKKQLFEMPLFHNFTRTCGLYIFFDLKQHITLHSKCGILKDLSIGIEF